MCNDHPTGTETKTSIHFSVWEEYPWNTHMVMVGGKHRRPDSELCTAAWSSPPSRAVLTTIVECLHCYLILVVGVGFGLGVTMTRRCRAPKGHCIDVRNIGHFDNICQLELEHIWPRPTWQHFFSAWAPSAFPIGDRWPPSPPALCAWTPIWHPHMSSLSSFSIYSLSSHFRKFGLARRLYKMITE